MARRRAIWKPLIFGSSFVLLSCTPYSSKTSPGPKSGGELSEAEQARRELAPLQLFPVRALGGQWSSKIEAASEPLSSQEPGYQRIIVPIGSERPVNCFVYRVPLDAGQAVTRMVRALSVGVEFSEFKVDSVDAVRGFPLVILHGKYVDAHAGEDPAGELKIAISPRTQFPAVCTHDEPGYSKSFSRIVRSFFGNISLLKKGKSDVPNKAKVEELWRLTDSGKPIGYALFRVYQGEGQQLTSLQVSATFTWQDGAFRTTDTVVLETEDEEGLVRGKWLDIADTRPFLQAMAERLKESPSQYRYIGEIDGRKLRGEFRVEGALRAESWLFRESLRRSKASEDKAWKLSFLQYLPSIDPAGASEVAYERRKGRDSLSFKKGAMEFEAFLGKEGLTERVQKSNSQVEAQLLFRHMDWPAALEPKSDSDPTSSATSSSDSD